MLAQVDRLYEAGQIPVTRLYRGKNIGPGHLGPEMQEVADFDLYHDYLAYR